MPGFKTIKVPQTPKVAVELLPDGHHVAELNKQFLFAGKALFTVSNRVKGVHFTYKIRVREFTNAAGNQTIAFLQVKAPGGKFPYRYVAIVQTDGALKTTTKSEFAKGTKEFDVAQWALSVVFTETLIPADYHIEHAGRCGRCARTLTHPESIKSGIGPECAEFIERMSA